MIALRDLIVGWCCKTAPPLGSAVQIGVYSWPVNTSRVQGAYSPRPTQYPGSRPVTRAVKSGVTNVGAVTDCVTVFLLQKVTTFFLF